MLGEVVPPVEENPQDESTQKHEDRTAETKEIKVSEFNERIRPGSSRSNSSRQTEGSGERSPETKRRGDKSARGEGKKLKKKRRSKSRDKLISKEKQKELLDEVEQEQRAEENKIGENDICSVENEARDSSFLDTTRSADETVNKTGSLNQTQQSDNNESLNQTQLQDNDDSLNRTQPPGKATEDEGKLSPLDMSSDSPPSDKDTNHNIGVASTAVPDSESDSDVPLDVYTKEDSQLELPEGYVRERKLSYDGRREDTEIFLEMAKRVATPPPPPAPPYDPPVAKKKSKKGTDNDSGDYHWDLDEHSSNITVDPESPSVLLRTETKKSTDGARGSVGLLQGRHEFEVRFTAASWGSHCSIGVCTTSARMQKKGYHDLLGRDKHSWGWDIPSRELFHNGESCGTWGDHVNETPTLIGLILDMDAGTMCIVLDGDYQTAKPVFTGLKEVGKPLYPAVATVFPGMEISIKRHQASPPPENPQVPEEASLHEPVLQQEDMSVWVGAEKIDEPGSEQEDGSQIESACESEDKDTSWGANKSVLDKDYQASQGDTEGSAEHQENGEQGKETSTTEVREGEQSLKTEEEERTEEGGSEEPKMGEQNQECEEKSFCAPDDEDDWEEELAEESLLKEENPGDNQYSETTDALVTQEVAPSEEKESPVPEERLQSPLPNQVTVSETAPTFSSYNILTAAKQEAQRAQVDMEQEIEQSPVIQVSSLDPDDQYSLRILYAWDATLKAAKLQIYPGVPYICCVEPNFEDKFVGVRCRRTVKTGCHRWRLREMIMNTPNMASTNPHTPDIPSNIFVGVVNGEHRTFNYGFSLTQIGRHAWGWNYRKRRMMNAANSMTFPTVDQDETNPNFTDDVLDIDLRLGLDIVMDCDRKKLTFEHNGEIFDTSGCYRIFGKEFSPFVVFNGRCRAPVTIEYISGPEVEIETALDAVKKLKPLDWADFAGFRPASTQILTSTGIQQVEDKHSDNYGWGHVSPGVSQIAGNVVCFTKGNRQVAISSMPLCSGRHTIDLSISNTDNLTIGFISPGASVDELLRDPSVLGGGLNSWAWFVPGSWLVHAGSTIGKYPYMVKDYDQSQLSDLRVVVTMKENGGVVGFSIPSDNGKNLDLGLAFFNVPSDLRIVITGTAGQDSSQDCAIKMVYKSGPTGFVEELRTLTSKVCTIL